MIAKTNPEIFASYQCELYRHLHVAVSSHSSFPHDPRLKMIYYVRKLNVQRQRTFFYCLEFCGDDDDDGGGAGYDVDFAD